MLSKMKRQQTGPLDADAPVLPNCDGWRLLLLLCAGCGIQRLSDGFWRRNLCQRAVTEMHTISMGFGGGSKAGGKLLET